MHCFESSKSHVFKYYFKIFRYYFTDVNFNLKLIVITQVSSGVIELDSADCKLHVRLTQIWVFLFVFFL